MLLNCTLKKPKMSNLMLYVLITINNSIICQNPLYPFKWMFCMVCEL